MSNKHILVIGIDGATFELIDPYIQEGALPTLGALAERGVRGELESTIPPITGPAWASFMTGCNPARHSIGDFMRRRPGGYTLQPVNSSNIRTITLWEWMSRAGKRVVVLNVPVTYPPSPVNGVMVTGLLTPNTAQDFAYPAGVGTQLYERFEYQIHLREAYSKGRVEPYLEDLRQMEAKRAEAAKYLMQNTDWDFCMVHFVATDAIQHTLWHLIDPSHPRHDPDEAARYGNAICEIYQQVDGAIANLIALAGEDTTVLVISDHGFGPLHKYIYLNNWLLKEGFLRLKRDPLTLLKYVFFNLGFTPELLYRTIERLGLAKFAFRAGKGTRYGLMRLLFLSVDNIEWSKTVAYSYGNIGQIYINLQGREPEGIVSREEYPAVRQRIMERLETLSDPETGEAVAGRIFAREEVYDGPYIEDMADILMLPKDMSYQAAGMSEFMSNAIMRSSFAYSGGHRMNGVFLAAGEDLQTGRVMQGARLIDMGPTILYLMGLPVPSYMDGRVLTEALEEGTTDRRPIEHVDVGEDKISGGADLSDEEEQQIIERLRSLGYVT